LLKAPATKGLQPVYEVARLQKVAECEFGEEGAECYSKGTECFPKGAEYLVIVGPSCARIVDSELSHGLGQLREAATEVYGAATLGDGALL